MGVGGEYLASEEMEGLWASRLDKRALDFLRGRSVPILEFDFDIMSTKRVSDELYASTPRIFAGNVAKCFEVLF